MSTILFGVIILFTITVPLHSTRGGEGMRALQERVQSSSDPKDAMRACDEALNAGAYSILEAALHNRNRDVQGHVIFNLLHTVPVTERKRLILAALLSSNVWPDSAEVEDLKWTLGTPDP